MNTNHMTPVANNDFSHPTPRNSGKRLVGIESLLVAFSVLTAIVLSVWLFFSTSVTHVSAAANEESSSAPVPYFPGQYVNQASEPSPVPATF